MDFSKFDLLWADIRIYPPADKILKHKHKFFHFIYVDEGIGNISIGEANYSMASGNIYLVPPDTFHGFVWSKENPLKTIEIKFSIDDAETENGIIRMPGCMNVEEYEIKSLLLSIYKEGQDKKPFCKEIKDLKFRLFLTELMRCCSVLNGEDDSNENHSKYPPEMSKVLEYINKNLEEELSLEILAEIAGFEKNYFIRKFKQTFSRTPMMYLQEVRIKKAKELLRYSDLSISQIADITGFKNIHYFSNVFLKNTEVRPFEYREKFYKS